MAHDKHDFILPLSVITVIDVNHLERELKALDEFSLQYSIRDTGKMPKIPRTSRSLEDLAAQNSYNLLLADDRKKLSAQLMDLKEHAPIMHMSFATDPNASFLGKIITWFRDEVHPFVLLQIGLQPNIAAGCVLRTPNKYFDFSLRQHFDKQRQLLIDSLVDGT